MSKWLVASISALLLCALSPSWADNVKQQGGYTVYYNAFNADLLDPRVASAYQLGHTCGHGIVTIAVHGKGGVPVPAAVNVIKTNLIGQQQRLKMHEIRDGKAVYYVGDFFIDTSTQPLSFDLQVTPQGDNSSIPIRLQQEFYTC